MRVDGGLGSRRLRRLALNPRPLMVYTQTAAERCREATW